MKKKLTLLFLLTLSLLSLSNTILTIYLPSNYYNWIRTLPAVVQFQKENALTIHFVSFDGTNKMLTRLELEKNNPKADIVMGLSQMNTIIANQSNLLYGYTPQNISLISNSMKHYILSNAIPFDYGNLAILYDPSVVKNPPKTFMALAKSNYPLIICDPRTSSTGQDFLLWTIAALGPNWQTFWKLSKNSISFIAPSWDSAFSQFEAGESPMMVSYASDEAYSYYSYNSSRYKVLSLSDGSYLEVEFNAIINKQNVSPYSRKFIELMLTPSVQSTIALNNWMLPTTNVALPEIFNKYYPVSTKQLSIPNIELLKNLNLWLEQWQSIVLR
ncbi:MAG: thiamine ABC transporter substrate-binding protein [Fusobacteria bacterium]|nr:thiamine ABC transporter substrate-binding protein [Fusobacteriota bacterium]